MSVERKKALRLSEIAATYQLSESWLRGAIRAGRLPAYRPSRHFLVLEEDLLDFLEESRVEIEDAEDELESDLQEEDEDEDDDEIEGEEDDDLEGDDDDLGDEEDDLGDACDLDDGDDDPDEDG